MRRDAVLRYNGVGQLHSTFTRTIMRVHRSESSGSGRFCFGMAHVNKDARLREMRDGIAERAMQQRLPGTGDGTANTAISRTRRPLSKSQPCRTPVARKMGTASYEDLPDVLTPREARAFLHPGRNAIYAALQDGRIRSIRYSQKFLACKATLREFLGRDAEHPSAGIPVKGTT